MQPMLRQMLLSAYLEQLELQFNLRDIIHQYSNASRAYSQTLSQIEFSCKICRAIDFLLYDTVKKIKVMSNNGKPINVDSTDHFYARRRPNIQMGFHKLFCIKYKISVAILIECLEQYRLQNQSNPHQPWNKEFTLDCCSANFDKLIKIVYEKTGIKVGDKVKRRRRDSYNDWFQQCSTDGSFAYNGSADDF